MEKLNKISVILLILLSIMLISSGCNKDDTEKSYNLDQFVSELKSRNYELELKDVTRDFLPTTRKRIAIGDEAIDVYVFSSSESMEKEAGNIEPSGFGYESKGIFTGRAVKVSWVSTPHFYKRGNIIVQYIGENEKILSDLKDIFGAQFAGQ